MPEDTQTRLRNARIAALKARKKAAKKLVGPKAATQKPRSTPRTPLSKILSPAAPKLDRNDPASQAISRIVKSKYGGDWSKIPPDLRKSWNKVLKQGYQAPDKSILRTLGRSMMREDSPVHFLSTEAYEQARDKGIRRKPSDLKNLIGAGVADLYEGTPRVAEGLGKRGVFKKAGETKVAGIGIPGGKYIGEAADRIVSDVYMMTVGLPAGTVGLIAHPKQSLAAIKQDYGYRYGPLFRGDIKSFVSRNAEHPVFFALDLAGGASIAFKGGQISGLIAKTSPIRRVRYGTGSVQPHRSQSELTAAAQHWYDRFSERNPHMPVVGSVSRIKRRLPYEMEIRFDAEKAKSVPFQEAAKNLSGVEQVALDLVGRYGDKAVQYADQEISRRAALANREGTSRRSRRLQENQIVAIQEAKASLLEPSERLTNAYANAYRLAGMSEEELIRSGLISRETAEARKNLSARIFGELPPIDEVAARERFYELAKKHLNEDEAAAALAAADAMVRGVASHTGVTPTQLWDSSFSAAKAQIEQKKLILEGGAAPNFLAQITDGDLRSLIEDMDNTPPTGPSPWDHGEPIQPRQQRKILERRIGRERRNADRQAEIALDRRLAEGERRAVQTYVMSAEEAFKMEADPNYVYHGTSSANLERARSEGSVLSPQDVRGEGNQFVWLADNPRYSALFAQVAGERDGTAAVVLAIPRENIPSTAIFHEGLSGPGTAYPSASHAVPGDVFFQETNAPKPDQSNTWFSKIENTISELPSRFSRQEVESRLKKTPGVKQDEWKWMGMDKILDDLFRYNKSVSREDLIRATRKKSPRFHTEIRSSHSDDLEYTDYVLPGEWTEARETTLHWPDIQENLLDEYGNKVDYDEYGAFLMEEWLEENPRPGPGADYGEIDAWESNRYKMEENLLDYVKSITPIFDSPHFEYRSGNLIGHIRSTERMIENRPVFLIEETQSDWHQKGARYGYRRQDDGDTLREAEKAVGHAKSESENAAYDYVDAVNDAIDRGSRVTVFGYSDEFLVERANVNLANSVPEPELTVRSLSNEGVHTDPYYQFTIKTAPEDVWGALQRYQEKIENLTDARNASSQISHRIISGPPDAPWSKNWEELLFRESVRQAVEKGSPGIAWTTGSQQAERYDKLLGDNFDRLEWDGRSLIASNKEGVLQEVGAREADLVDYVGTNLAKKLKDKLGEEEPLTVGYSPASNPGWESRPVSDMIDGLEDGDLISLNMGNDKFDYWIVGEDESGLYLFTKDSYAFKRFFPDRGLLDSREMRIRPQELKEAYENWIDIFDYEKTYKPAILEGNEISIGGGGFIDAYDRRMKSYASKYLKSEPRKVPLDDNPDIRVWYVDFTEEFLSKLRNEGNVLQQRSRGDKGQVAGAVSFDETGRGIVAFSSLADLSTFVHEPAHILRRILPDDHLHKIEEILGVENGVWTTANEEDFARLVESYFWRGKEASPQLRETVQLISSRLRDIYNSPPVRGFDIEARDALYSVLDELYDPTRDLKAGNGAFFVPDVESYTGRAKGIAKRSLTKGRKEIYPSRGILYESGRIIRKPKTIVQHWNKVARIAQHRVTLKQAESFSFPLDLESYPGRSGLAPGFVFFNPDGYRIPRSIRELPTEEDLLGLLPEDLSAMIASDHAQMVDLTFPDSIAQLPPGMKERVRQIPREIADGFRNGQTIFAGHSPAWQSILARTIDTTNAIAKTATVYGKLSYIPLNIAGNVVFLTIEAGPFAAPALIRSSRALSHLDGDLLAKIDYEVGEGAMAALETSEATNAVTRTAATIAHWQSKIADRGPRRAAWIWYAAKEGLRSEKQLRELFDNPNGTFKEDSAFGKITNAEIRRQISESAEKAMVQFRGMGPFQRAVISRAFFIYGWLRGAAKYAGRSPFERPLRTNLIAHLGQQGYDEMEDELGKVASYIDGLVKMPWEKQAEKLGLPVVPVRNLRAINPVSTGGEALAALAAFATGQQDIGPQVSDYLSPPIKMGVEASLSYNTFFQEPYENRWEAIYGPPQRWPAIKAITGLLDLQVTDPQIGKRPLNRQPNFIVPDEQAARREWLEELLLGSARKRYYNVKAGQYRAIEESAATEERADFKIAQFTEDAEKSIGRQPPQAVIDQYRLKLQLDEEIKDGMTYKERVRIVARHYARTYSNPRIIASVRGLNEENSKRVYRKLRSALYPQYLQWKHAIDKGS